MWVETRRRYVLFVLTIVAGATMTHSLVPPPGPLFVADAMGIPIALMMQQGAIVAAAAALSGYAYALYADHRWGARFCRLLRRLEGRLSRQGGSGERTAPAFARASARKRRA